MNQKLYRLRECILGELCKAQENLDKLTSQLKGEVSHTYYGLNALILTEGNVAYLSERQLSLRTGIILSVVRNLLFLAFREKLVVYIMQDGITYWALADAAGDYEYDEE